MSFSPTIIITSRDKLLKRHFETFRAKEKRGCNIIGCFSSNDEQLSKEWESEYKILSLCFDDIDTTGPFPIYNNEKEKTLSFQVPPKCILFNDNLAIKCIDYIKTTKNLLNWIIFCDVGMSRSPAIGDFIARVLSKAANDWRIHYEFLLEYAYQSHPNRLVSEKLNKHFNETVSVLCNKIK